MNAEYLESAYDGAMQMGKKLRPEDNERLNLTFKDFDYVGPNVYQVSSSPLYPLPSLLFPVTE